MKTTPVNSSDKLVWTINAGSSTIKIALFEQMEAVSSRKAISLERRGRSG